MPSHKAELTGLTFVVSVLLLSSSTAKAQGVRCQGREDFKLTASDGDAGDWFGDRVAIDGDVAVVGAEENDDAGEQTGSAYVYRFDGSDWVEEAKLLASDAVATARFGISVAVSGDVIIVGADQDPEVADYAGAAYVFRYDGSAWVQEQKLTASDGQSSDWFGWTVDMDGEVAVVGANGHEEGGPNAFNSGAVYVFRYDGSSWVEESMLTAFDADIADGFGRSLALDGEVLVVATPNDDDEGANTGAAYVFRHDGTDWVFEQKLLARDAHLFDFFGNSVDVQDDALVVGAWGESRNNAVFAGAAYVFRYNGTTWKQERKLIASDAQGNDHFGNSVSMSGDMILVGARFDNPACPTSLNCNSGSAYLFQNNGHNRWIEKGWLRPTDMAYQDNFGQGVALSGNRAVIGALNNDDAGADSGSAYIFFALSDCDDNRRLDLCDLFFDSELDSDGNGMLDVCEGLLEGELDLDIKPGACPNVYNPSSSGVLTAAVSAPAGFDLQSIDESSITISRTDGVGGALAPCDAPFGRISRFNDIATPSDTADCSCEHLGADGNRDLVLSFSSAEMTEVLELMGMPAGSSIELGVDGILADGTPFEVHDCITLVPPG
jgi:hypothetical protein